MKPSPSRIRLALVIAMLLGTALPAAAGPKRQMVRDVIQCTRMQQRFILARDLGFETGLNSSIDADAIPDELKQQMLEAYHQVADEVFSWDKVEPKYEQLYGRHYTENELKTVLELCQDSRYQMVLRKDLEMLPGGLKIGEEFAPELQAKLLDAMTRLMKTMRP